MAAPVDYTYSTSPTQPDLSDYTQLTLNQTLIDTWSGQNYNFPLNSSVFISIWTDGIALYDVRVTDTNLVIDIGSTSGVNFTSDAKFFTSVIGAGDNTLYLFGITNPDDETFSYIIVDGNGLIFEPLTTVTLISDGLSNIYVNPVNGDIVLTFAGDTETYAILDSDLNTAPVVTDEPRKSGDASHAIEIAKAELGSDADTAVSDLTLLVDSVSSSDVVLLQAADGTLTAIYTGALLGDEDSFTATIGYTLSDGGLTDSGSLEVKFNGPSTGVLTLTASQALELADADPAQIFAVTNAYPQIVLSDSAATIAALDGDQVTELHFAGVSQVALSDAGPLVLTGETFNYFYSSGITFSSASNVIFETDVVTLSFLNGESFQFLQAQGISKLSLDSGSGYLALSQAEALIAYGVSFISASDVTVHISLAQYQGLGGNLPDISAANLDGYLLVGERGRSIMTLDAVAIAALGQAGVTQIDLTDNVVSLTREQINAFRDAGITFAGDDQVSLISLTPDATLDGWRSGTDLIDTLYGTEFADGIRGRGGDDYIEGRGGNDRILGGDGNDVIFGGDGDDTLFGDAGDDVLAGGAGNDTLRGGAGDDVLRGNAGDDIATGGLGDDKILGGTGNDRLFGNEGNDVIDGEGGDDIISGDDGNDRLYGGTGNDYIRGGNGRDTIDGGAGHDTLAGDAGNDIIYGGDGNDRIIGGFGSDVLTGGAGKDTFVFIRAEGKDVITDFEAVGTDHDMIDVTAVHYADFAAVQAAMTQSGGNVILTLAGNNQVTINNVTIAELTADHFII
ncbi:hypothetical protein IAI18_10210 [Acetobacteraceae bacterium H6797]|nr:hypothetical protein [Acetobacteraceae bacterium H6797]